MAMAMGFGAEEEDWEWWIENGGLRKNNKKNWIWGFCVDDGNLESG